MKRVNTTNPLAMADEDRSKVLRSDVGNKMTEQIHQTTTAKQKQTKKEKLLANPDIRRWYDNTARGSLLTADVRLRRLSHFCEINNIAPMELAKLGMKNLRAVTDLILDHVSWMEKQNKSPGYRESTVTAIKSWLRHFDVEIRRKIKIDDPDATPTLANEKVPERDEIAEIFNRTSLRTAASISLIAKAGLRPQVLGNHDGTDGLVLRDIPDIAINKNTALCVTSPVRILVRRTLSKARHQYFAFLTESGTSKLLTYLNDRLAKGETLDLDSAVIAPDRSYKVYRGKNTGKKFLPTNRITKDIREALRPRFHWRPYVLRAYFDTQLLMAESRGKIAHDFRVFFMGHKGSIEARYTTNKGMLPQTLVNEMRNAFRRSQEFLDLEMSADTIEQSVLENEHASKTSETRQQLQPEQIIVKIDQVEEMIFQGWKFLSNLPNEKAILEQIGFGKRPV